MEKKNYKYYSYVKSSFNYINRALASDKKITLHTISEGLRNIVNSYADLNRNERYNLYRSAYEVSRAAYSQRRAGGNWHQTLSFRKNYDKILRASRKVGQAQLRKKKLHSIRAILDSADKEMSIFFMCSSHTKSAEDHKPYQGKIFVDRFWRTKVPGNKYRAVYSYIRNHNTITVQDIMKAPVYLFTRPNCRHYLIPVPLSTVLNSSPKKVAAEYLPPHHKELYTQDNYYHLRSEVYDSMNKAVPCKEYKIKARRR